jgi:hypothetical protein
MMDQLERILKGTVMARCGHSPSISRGGGGQRNTWKEPVRMDGCPAEGSNGAPSECETKMLFTRSACWLLSYSMTRESVAGACRLVLLG